MALCWSSLALLILGFSAIIDAEPTTLTPELAAFVPSCAHECFGGFLNANYPSTLCGPRPSLECLCSAKGRSDYTVGEGAIQCILAQVSLKVCGEETGQDAIAFKAYSMCSEKENALPNTHGTLTATLVVQTSLPTTSQTVSKTDSTSSTGSLTSSASSTFVTSTTTRTSTESSTSSTDTQSSPEEQNKAPVPAPMLTRQQVIGITAGSVVGGVSGVLALIIFACWRRRKAKAERDSGLLPFQLEPSNSLNHGNGARFKAGKKSIRSNRLSGMAGRIPPRIPPRLDTSVPNMFSRRSMKPELIGVAVSPEMKYDQERERRKSRLLPEKPSFAGTAPTSTKKNGLSFPQANGTNPSRAGRQSTATQFEEDIDSADTIFDDDPWGDKSRGNSIQPATGRWQTIQKVNTEPAVAAPAFFLPTRGGDNQRTEQASANMNANAFTEYSVKPLNISQGQVSSFSKPRGPEEYSSKSREYSQQQSKQNHQPQTPEMQPSVSKVERPTTGSSSLYNDRNSLPGSDNGLNKPRVPTLKGSKARRSYKTAGPYDTRKSGGSMTSFESMDSSPMSPDEPASPVRPTLALKTDMDTRRRTLQVELSPVVESPPSGRSPVSYPKIPKRGRLGENVVRMVPPPAQPNFDAAFSSGRMTGQQNLSPPSPLYASPTGATPIEVMKPWRVAEINAQRERDQQVGWNQAAPHMPPQQQQRAQVPQLGARIWPGQGASAINGPQSRNQFPQPQQRQQERQYIDPSTHYNNSAAHARSYTQPLPSDQQQVQGGNQFRPYQQPEQRSHTAPPQQPRPAFTSQQPYQPVNRTTSPVPISKFKSAPNLQAGPNTNPAPFNPSLLHTHKRTPSQASFQSQQSTSSSLLAKRRGEQQEKVLALNLYSSNLSGQVVNQTQKSTGSNTKWRVLNESSIQKAKSEAWKPMAGKAEQNAEREGDRQREMFARNEGYGFGEGDLPKTPGWMPKLTPTRRGDELFLSVQ